MTGDKRKFFNFEDYVGGSIKFGNGFCILIKRKGTILLDNDTSLHDVCFVEGLTHNLLSISQICDNVFSVTFNAQGCEINKKSGMIVGAGLRKKGNIYNLHETMNRRKVESKLVHFAQVTSISA